MAKRVVSLTAAALPILKAVIEKKTSIPILGFVKVEARGDERIAYATDLDTWAEVRVNDDTEPGLYRIMGNELQTATGESKIEHFPVLGEFKSGGTSLVLPVSLLRSHISCVSKEESRYTLNGVLLTVPSKRREPIVTAATDGHRLRVQYMTVAKNFALPKEQTDYLLPRKLLALTIKLAKSDSVTFTVNGSTDERNTASLRISTDTFTIYSRKMTGNFPNWRAVMSKGEIANHFAVNRDELIQAMVEIKPFCNERSGAVRLDLNETELTISAENDGYSKTITLPIKAEETVYAFSAEKFLTSTGTPGFHIVMPMRIDGGLIGLNREYVLDAAKGFSGERIYFGIKDGQTQVSLADATLLDGEESTPEQTALVLERRREERDAAVAVVAA